MKPVIFKNLLANRVRNTEDNDTVAFECKFKNYVLNFYACYTRGLKVDLDECYKDVKGYALELELTDEQWKELQFFIDNAEPILIEEEEESNEPYHSVRDYEDDSRFI